jgi:hypothetical protein
MAGEWTLVFGFKSEFNDDHTWSENHVLHKVAVSRERSDKWPNELLADGFLPLHERARKLKRHIFRVVRHNAILVRSSPRAVVLIDKRFNVNDRPECSRSRHGSLLRLVYRYILHQGRRARVNHASAGIDLAKFAFSSRQRCFSPLAIVDISAPFHNKAVHDVNPRLDPFN